MNMALKSGAKDFHGSAYEYFRNDAMDANNYFANLNGSQKPELRYNIFGFNVGGPVFIPKVYNRDKNRTFFFVNQEWRKIVQGNQIFAAAVPQAQRDGDFSALGTNILVPKTGDPAQQARFATFGLTPGSPFAGNRIPAALIDPNATLFFNTGAMPLPNASGNNFSGSRGVPTDVPETILKIDHYFTSKLSDYGALISTTVPIPDRYLSLEQLDLSNTRYKFQESLLERRSKADLSHQPDTGKRGCIQLQRQYHYSDTGRHICKAAGWTARNSSQPTRTIVCPPSVWAGLTVSMIRLPGPGTTPPPTTKFATTFPGPRGRTALSLAGSSCAITRIRTFSETRKGTIHLMVLLRVMRVADMLLGYTKTYSELELEDRGHWRTTTASLYATDNWRVTSRLTLNLALRDEIVPHAYDVQNRMSNFYPNLYNPTDAALFNSNGSLDPNGPGFKTVSGVPLSNTPFYLNGIGLAGKDGIPRGLVKNTYGSIGPRVGFAYDVTGKGKTIVRGGFGTFYERIQGNDVYNTGPNPPFSFNPQVTSVYFSNPSISALNGQQAALPIFPANFTALAYSDYKLPTTNDWNFGIQHQLFTGGVLSVAYVGNQAFHQRDNREVNPVSLSDPNRAAIASVTTIRIWTDRIRASGTSRWVKQQPLLTTIPCRSVCAQKTSMASLVRSPIHTLTQLTILAAILRKFQTRSTAALTAARAIWTGGTSS